MSTDVLRIAADAALTWFATARARRRDARRDRLGEDRLRRLSPHLMRDLGLGEAGWGRKNGCLDAPQKAARRASSRPWAPVASARRA